MRLLLISYALASLLIMVYGINCHIMVRLFRRGIDRRRAEDRERISAFFRSRTDRHLPPVTIQLPIFNELNVAERIIDAAAAMDYPRDRLEIQVLDDSTDETRTIIATRVRTLQQQGVPIHHICRDHRQGFKAGALREGMEQAGGEFMAIFDADFVPPADFLRQSIPHFLIDPQLGLVQARWGHLNAASGLLTELQSIGINGHFIIEQSARNSSDLFMNFNGTAGVIRKTAILEAGNWQDDTLTEDMDLSYRMQLAGWCCRYLIDLVAPAEIPQTINAFKSQQFRWAKGSIQTAIKLLPAVWRHSCGLFTKIQATLHMTHYLVHPLMVFLAITAPLLLWIGHFRLPQILFTLFGCLLLVSCTGPSRLYWTAEKQLGHDWIRRCSLLPLLVCLGCGLSISNSRAVLEAVAGKHSSFVRTPKRGDIIQKFYRPIQDRLFAVELLIGAWCLLGLWLYTRGTHYLVGFFLSIYATSFLTVGFLSWLDHRAKGRNP